LQKAKGFILFEVLLSFILISIYMILIIKFSKELNTDNRYLQLQNIENSFALDQNSTDSNFIFIK